MSALKTVRSCEIFSFPIELVTYLSTMLFAQKCFSTQNRKNNSLFCNEPKVIDLAQSWLGWNGAWQY